MTRPKVTAKLLISSVTASPLDTGCARSGERTVTCGSENSCVCSVADIPARPSRSAMAIEAAAWRMSAAVRFIPGSFA